LIKFPAVWEKMLENRSVDYFDWTPSSLKASFPLGWSRT